MQHTRERPIKTAVRIGGNLYMGWGHCRDTDETENIKPIKEQEWHWAILLLYIEEMHS